MGCKKVTVIKAFRLWGHWLGDTAGKTKSGWGKIGIQYIPVFPGILRIPLNGFQDDSPLPVQPMSKISDGEKTDPKMMFMGREFEKHFWSVIFNYLCIPLLKVDL